MIGITWTMRRVNESDITEVRIRYRLFNNIDARGYGERGYISYSFVAAYIMFVIWINQNNNARSLQYFGRMYVTKRKSHNLGKIIMHGRVEGRQRPDWPKLKMAGSSEDYNRHVTQQNKQHSPLIMAIHHASTKHQFWCVRRRSIVWIWWR